MFVLIALPSFKLLFALLKN